MSALDPILSGALPAAIAVFAATFAARAIAHRLGFVSRPRKGRWSQDTVALGGGVPIALALIAGAAFSGSELALVYAPALALVFLLGLIDDVRGVPPAGKLIVQALAAAYVVSFGILLPGPGPLLAIPLTIAWIVGLTNALNLLDNMDGLAAGIAAIAAIALAFLLDGFWALSAWILAGAALGFLIHNFKPARIFMGDGGSLPLGFALALLSTRVRIPGAPPWYALIAVAFLPLAVPLLDTALVAYTRRRAGRPFFLGGRDHTSHRLVALGLSERRAVLVLYACGALAGAGALSALLGVWPVILAAAALVAAGLALFGVFLSGAPVSYGSEGAAPLNRGGDPILIAVEIAVDIAVIALVWTLSHLMRFQNFGPETVAAYTRATVIPLLPFVLASKLGALFICGLHRGFFKALSLKDVYRIFKAASLGSLLLVLASALGSRLENLSRLVVALDWSLTFLAVLATRAALGALRRFTRRLASDAPKAAFFGPVFLEEAARLACADEGLDYQGRLLGPELDALDQSIAVLFVAAELEDARAQSLEERGIALRRPRFVED